MNDIAFMNLALTLAQKAESLQEVPVGAVLTHRNHIISFGYNERENAQSSLLHAEIVAIQKACAHLGSWRLEECTLYVTLEPCLMCAGAIIQARIPRVVFGAKDPKGGAFGSIYEFHNDKRLNHQPIVEDGVLAEESTRLMREFFMKKRLAQKVAKR